MKQENIEKIKKYLDFIKSEIYTSPGRFTAEQLNLIKEIGYDVRHYSFVDGKILTISDGNIFYSATKADKEHTISFKDETLNNYIIRIYEGENNQSDYIRNIIGRDDLTNEDWLIIESDMCTSIRNIQNKNFETINPEVVNLFLDLQTYLKKENPDMRARLVVNI